MISGADHTADLSIFPRGAIHFHANDADDAAEHEDRQSTADLCRSLLDADASLSAVADSGLLSHEARLILQLAVKDGLIVKEAALSSRLSDRAFYELSKRLERQGAIRLRAAPNDLRTKRIHLSDDLWAGLSRIVDTHLRTDEDTTNPFRRVAQGR